MISFISTPLLQLTLDIAEEAQSSELTGSQTGFGGFVGSVLGGTMMIAFILVLIYLLWGGIEWISAGGDSSKVQKARDKITQAVIGIIVLGSAVAIFNLLQVFLGVQVLNIGTSSGPGILEGLRNRLGINSGSIKSPAVPKQMFDLTQ